MGSELGGEMAFSDSPPFMIGEDYRSLTLPTVTETVLRRAGCGAPEDLNCEKLHLPVSGARVGRGGWGIVPAPAPTWLGASWSRCGRASRELSSSRACGPLAAGLASGENGEGMGCGDSLGTASSACFFGISSFPE